MCWLSVKLRPPIANRTTAGKKKSQIVIIILFSSRKIYLFRLDEEALKKAGFWLAMSWQLHASCSLLWFLCCCGVEFKYYFLRRRLRKLTFEAVNLITLHLTTYSKPQRPSNSCCCLITTRLIFFNNNIKNGKRSRSKHPLRPRKHDLRPSRSRHHIHPIHYHRCLLHSIPPHSIK
jgi:hypothetical protein